MTANDLRSILKTRMEWDESDLAPVTVGGLIDILKACGLLESQGYNDPDLVHSNHGTHKIVRQVRPEKE